MEKVGIFVIGPGEYALIYQLADAYVKALGIRGVGLAQNVLKTIENHDLSNVQLTSEQQRIIIDKLELAMKDEEPIGDERSPEDIGTGEAAIEPEKAAQ